MLTFAEEILLLTLDDESGKFVYADSTELRYALAGSVLMDLALRSKIDTDLKKLYVVDSTPTGEEILDRYLTTISAVNEDHSTRYWVTEIAKDGDGIKDKALSMLLEKGILKVKEKKILWVFETRRYPVVDDTEEKEVKKRILDLVLSDEIPTPRDVVLVSLVDACKLFPKILSSHEAERLAPRIEQIRRLDLIGQAVSQVLDRLRSDLANVMLLHHW